MYIKYELYNASIWDDDITSSDMGGYHSVQSIAVRDFGPISQAEVELKPLTVLIGPNGTGKSYLALAIYALSRAIGVSYPQYNLRRSPALPRLWLRARANTIANFEEEVGELRKLMPEWESLSADRVEEISKYPPSIREWIRRQSDTWPSILTDEVRYELNRCFGSNLNRLRRASLDTEINELIITLRNESSGLQWQMRSEKDKLTTDGWETDLSRASLEIDLSFLPHSEIHSDRPYFLADILLSQYSKFLVDSYSTTSHYLPATRSGILLGHKTLASLIVDRASTAWIEPMEIERLPGVVTDLIRALLTFQRGEQEYPEVSEVIEFLESKVAGGTIDLENQPEYPDIIYENPAGEFLLHQVSSMVSEIAPLVLFLKYLVRPGHRLILEEPESHLDPTNQRHLARVIAMLVKAGVQVLVTTHSDIFLSQINNLMQAAQHQSKGIQKTEYASTELLDPSQVAAYVFRPTVNGTQVDPLRLDPDYGIPTESFDEVHRALYDEAIMFEHLE